MHDSCMATKTISLELDAYEMLRRSKRPGESFSAVVRRAVFPEHAPTGAELLEHYGRGGARVSPDWLERVEHAITQDPPPDDPWS